MSRGCVGTKAFFLVQGAKPREVLLGFTCSALQFLKSSIFFFSFRGWEARMGPSSTPSSLTSDAALVWGRLLLSNIYISK
mmetsp:Transcript_16077/g.41323  ORF Transcript_16077/g.41323 Transcript_16077/m.41323 type:complete len:80 (-) Transcript_16077:1872-2111(-)